MVRYVMKGDEAPNLIKITSEIDIELSALEVKIGPITKLYEVPVTPEPPLEGEGTVPLEGNVEESPSLSSMFPLYVSLTGEETSRLNENNLVVVSKYNYDKKITFMGKPMIIHTCTTPVCPQSETGEVILSDSQNLINLNLFSTPQLEEGKFVEITPTVEGYIISTDGGATWGKIEGLLEDQLDLKEALDEKQPLLTEGQLANIDDVPNKAYTTYVNEELSKKQPLGDYATTSDLSNATSTLQRNINEVDEVVQTSLGDVSYNSSNGVVTFTKNDSSTTTINLPTELTITGVDYDEVTNELVLTRVDGSEIRVPLTALIDVYNGSDGSNIQITISGNNTISAILKTGTISRSQLNVSIQNELNSLADGITENARVLEDKQNTLVSGETIKTINNQNILGSGNIVIEGGSGGTTIHNNLTGRDVAGAHPMSVITGLNEALSGKQPIGDYALSSQIPTKTSELDNDSQFVNETQLNAVSTVANKADTQSTQNKSSIDTINTELPKKQNKLTAGNNITIENDVISATGGGSSDLPVNDKYSAVHQGGYVDLFERNAETTTIEEFDATKHNSNTVLNANSSVGSSPFSLVSPLEPFQGSYLKTVSFVPASTNGITRVGFINNGKDWGTWDEFNELFSIVSNVIGVMTEFKLDGTDSRVTINTEYVDSESGLIKIPDIDGLHVLIGSEINYSFKYSGTAGSGTADGTGFRTGDNGRDYTTANLGVFFKCEHRTTTGDEEYVVEGLKTFENNIEKNTIEIENNKNNISTKVSFTEEQTLTPEQQTLVKSNLNISDSGSVEKYNPLKGKKISFLGDSITTFENWIPSGNARFYPAGDVQDVNDTYWKKLVDELELELVVNNSWSGCTLVTGTSRSSVITENRHKELHTADATPDIIFINVGTNDFRSNVAVGEYDGMTATPTLSQCNKFREALGYVLSEISKTYLAAQIWVCTLGTQDSVGTFGTYPETNGNGVVIHEFNNAVREIATAYGARVIEISQCGITLQNVNNYMIPEGYDLHPNKAGMELYFQQASRQMIANATSSVKIGENIVDAYTKEETDNLLAVKADKFPIKTTLDTTLTDKTEYNLDPQSANITITGATGEGIIYFIATADLTLTIPTGHLLAVGSTAIKANTNNQIIYNQNMWYIISVGA